MTASCACQKSAAHDDPIKAFASDLSDQLLDLFCHSDLGMIRRSRVPIARKRLWTEPRSGRASADFAEPSSIGLFRDVGIDQKFDPIALDRAPR
jgi:hypothetical protein